MLHKFQLRAWDEKTKTMYFPHSIHFNSANNISYVKDIYMKERKDLILMEFTGLYIKRNNGHFHKIFERDIIEIVEGLFVVERYNGAFGYYASDKRMGFIPFVNHNYIKISEKGVIEGVNLKGNIYENSALITLYKNAKSSADVEPKVEEE